MAKTLPIQRTPAAAAFTRLILETFRLNGRLLTAGDRLTRDLGLSSALWQVLGAVSEGPATMAQIARKMGLSRQGVRRSVTVLIQKDYVEFTPNPHHQRAQLVAMTPIGEQALADTTAIQTAWANGIAGELEPAELERAVAVLQALSDRI
jgi:DNA-binding MarR family transcriptional regulator